MDTRRESFTRLLQRCRAEGDGVAAAELMPIVYDELRELAERQLGGERRGGAHTLQPTALVHEVWLRMADDRLATVEDRAHFRSLCARVMRRLLVEHARKRHAEKRGGGAERVTLATSGVGEPQDPRGEHGLDLLALDEALERLAALDERKARVVDLRWFGGLTNAETAEVLGVSLRTVEGDWAFARAWLRDELIGGEG